MFNELQFDNSNNLFKKIASTITEILNKVFVLQYIGIAFEMGRILPTPETVPFRLTRDIVDAMGASGVEGVFRR